MIQRELKNKTKRYTLAAVLSAIMIASAIYAVTTPTVMYGALGMSPMKHFNSMDDLRNYLNTNTLDTDCYSTCATLSLNTFWSRGDPMPDPQPAYSVSAAETSSDSFSKTNIQVAGVDEIDVVKTDGKYIYTLNYNNVRSNNIIQIVNADSNNPVVVGKIVFDGSTNIYGMYLSENGNKLAIIGCTYQYYDYYGYNGLVPLNEDADSDTSEPVRVSPSIVYFSAETFIHVYDVSNKAAPVLTRTVTLSGNYANSRMVGNYIYLVVNQPVYTYDEAVILPRISNDAITKEIVPASIYYTDIQDTYFSYTLFSSINIINDNEQTTDMTILMGASSCMYVSTDNMYVTFYDAFNVNTELYRVSFNGANLSFKAKGTVPGYVLNQYSMDEYNNYFRIATTVNAGPWDNRIEYNNLYVLNMNLNTVGKLEKLADGERIYSARFAGDKAYLVTFEQIDPFFVLDLKNPTSPKVAGELKIPGFSSYLHPYSENYVIGLGQEDRAVKLSLFDVTNMSNPKEIAKYLIAENDTFVSSAALYEPKAFLFDQQKQFLVIPIHIYHHGYWEIEPTPIVRDKDVIDNSSISDSDQYSNGLWRDGSFWSGVYAFKVSPENGFTLQSVLSHKPTGINNNSDWYNTVNRSLYIGNTLYTISNDMIQLYSLDDFRVIAKVNF